MLRVHPALGRGGRFRSFLRHPGKWLPHAERRRNGGIRPAERAEGLSGRQRGAGVRESPISTTANPPSFPWEGLLWETPEPYCSSTETRSPSAFPPAL